MKKNKQLNESHFLRITKPHSVFLSCFKLVSKSITDLLDFIELDSQFQVSVLRKWPEFVP